MPPASSAPPSTAAAPEDTIRVGDRVQTTFKGGGVVAELHADGCVTVDLVDTQSKMKFRRQDVNILAEGEPFIWGPSYHAPAPAQPAAPKPEPAPVPPAANGRARKSAYDCEHCGSSNVSDHIGGGRRMCYDCKGYL